MVDTDDGLLMGVGIPMAPASVLLETLGGERWVDGRSMGTAADAGAGVGAGTGTGAETDALRLGAGIGMVVAAGDGVGIGFADAGSGAGGCVSVVTAVGWEVIAACASVTSEAGGVGTGALSVAG